MHKVLKKINWLNIPPEQHSVPLAELFKTVQFFASSRGAILKSEQLDPFSCMVKASLSEVLKYEQPVSIGCLVDLLDIEI